MNANGPYWWKVDAWCRQTSYYQCWPKFMSTYDLTLVCICNSYYINAMPITSCFPVHVIHMLSFFLTQINPSKECHNASDRYPIMYHLVTETWTCVHVSVTQWCIVGYGRDALCEMHNILISLFHCFSWSGIILCMPPSQWETSLHCNVISHCLGPYTKWSLHDAPTSHSHFLYYVNPRCHHNCNTAMQHVSPSHYPQLCKYLFACYESHNPSPEEMLWSNYIKGIIIH